MTVITVKEIKEQWKNPAFTLFIDDKQSNFNAYGSRLLTNTCSEDGDGIFNTENTVVRFKRKDTWVTVTFDLSWDALDCIDPAREIKRRILDVEEAFEAVSEGYEKVWTVNLDDDNEYIEKRKAEASQASHYSDSYGINQYEIELYENDINEDEDGDEGEGFHIIEEDGNDIFILFSKIPADAYFLKLTRID